jgi:hypothetical protein
MGQNANRIYLPKQSNVASKMPPQTRRSGLTNDPSVALSYTIKTHKVLGKGTYGTVFLPMYPCGDHADIDEKSFLAEKMVSKISDLDEAQTEFDTSQQIINLIEPESRTDPTKIIRNDETLILPDKQIFRSYKFGTFAQSACPMVDPDIENSSERFIKLLKTKDGKAINDLIEKLEKGDPPRTDLRGPVAREYETNRQLRLRSHQSGTGLGVIQMEKADGNVFNAITQLRKQNPSSETLCKWMHALKNAAIGLKRMHDKNWFHLDVKMENMVYFGTFENPTTVKLCDFGLTKNETHPEFSESFAFTTLWSNWPSLGVLIYRLKHAYSDKQKELIYRNWKDELQQLLAGSSDENEKADPFRQTTHKKMHENVKLLLDQWLDPVQYQLLFKHIVDNLCKKDLHDLYCAIDSYGLVLAIAYFHPLMPTTCQKYVEIFFEEAFHLDLSDDALIQRIDELIKKLNTVSVYPPERQIPLLKPVSPLPNYTTPDPSLPRITLSAFKRQQQLKQQASAVARFLRTGNLSSFLKT